MEKDINWEQLQFFETCMESAGYKDYETLAADIILGLPTDAPKVKKPKKTAKKSNQKLVTAIYELAAGVIPPIQSGSEKDGQPSSLALEIATLLNVDFDELFAESLPQAHEIAKIDTPSSLEAPLTERDICKIFAMLTEVQQHVFIEREFNEKEVSDIAKDNLGGFNLSEAAVKKNLYRAHKKLEELGQEMLLCTDHQPDSDLYYRPRTFEDLRSQFSASRLATDFVFEAKRALNVSSHPNVPEHIKSSLSDRFNTRMRVFEDTMAILDPEGKRVLSGCSGYDLVQVLEAYESLGTAPGVNFMLACVELGKRIAEDRDRYMYLGSLQRVVARIKSFDSTSDIPLAGGRWHSNTYHKDLCDRLLAIR